MSIRTNRWFGLFLVRALVLVLPVAGGVLAQDNDGETHEHLQLTPFQVDGNHSSVEFKIRHFVSNVPGNFRDFSGTIQLDPDHLDSTQVEAVIQVASLDTGNDDRDGHLKSEDFFAAEEFPTITFKSTKAEKVDESNFTLTGDLTIRGVTKPVTLAVEVLGIGPGFGGSVMLGLEAIGTVNRQDFGANWNRQLDKGGYVLGDDVTLSFSIEAKYVEKPAATD